MGAVIVVFYCEINNMADMFDIYTHTHIYKYGMCVELASKRWLPHSYGLFEKLNNSTLLGFTLLGRQT